MAKPFRSNVIGTITIQGGNKEHVERTWGRIEEMLRYRYPNMKVELVLGQWEDQSEMDSDEYANYSES